MKRKKSIIIMLAIIFHVSLIIVAAFNVTIASEDSVKADRKAKIPVLNVETSE